MSGRNAQVSRIYAIFDLLEGTPSGLTVAELYERVNTRGHEASKRTIYRDIDALAQAGFPLFPEGDDESNQRWRLDRKAKVNDYFILNARELFALYLARGALTPLKDTPFFQDLESIFTRLEQRLGAKQAEYFQGLHHEIKFEPGPQWGLGLDPNILETIRSGCAEGQLIECLYYSVNSKSESTRKLGPHYLYYSRGGLYLVAEDINDAKVKVFAVPRMKNATLLDEIYKGQITTPEEFFDGAMSIYQGSKSEEIIVEFDAEVAQFVKERRWHPSQRVTSLDKGRLRVHLELGQTPELISWVLGFGPSAKVVQPETLAERLAVQAMNTYKLYGKKSG